MKYEIEISGKVLIEAPNVAKAYLLARKFRLIGSASGHISDHHDRGGYSYSLESSALKFSKPKRIP